MNLNRADLDTFAASAARDSLLAYAIGMNPAYQTPSHIELLADKLEAVHRGEIKRLMVFLPPRHGKSNLCSELFPPWYMGHHPKDQVMFTTYGQDLADGFGRKVRNALADERHVRSFPGSVLAQDSRSAQRFNTTVGGVYYAVGAGGAITGRGANLLVIDDPIRNREDADSKLIRDKLWDWYASTAYTRLMPGGAVVLVQCMTGDTQVLMADGSEVALRDIRAGDLIATYEDGGLTTSTVRNWVNQGGDRVYRIKTSSGTIVKANERHPFLVQRHGSTEWIKVKDLRIGDKVMRATGASGPAFSVPQRDATSQLAARACAPATTTSTCGQAVTDRLPTTLNHATRPGSSEGTDSRQMSSRQCLKSKAAAAPSASSHRETTCERTGAGNFASIIATTAARFGAFFATTATSLWGMARQRKSSSPPLSTYEITPDHIVEISDVGFEDVFDIEVERTENFIANGLVSHNTRWHEDDLAGRLLNGHEKWDTITLPALAEPDDALGRKVGDALWPEQYGEPALQTIRQTIGEREFVALYQQRPSALEGAMFKREWLHRAKAPRAGMRIAMGVDLALSTKTSADYTAIVVIGRDEFGKLYILDAVRDRVDFSGALRLIRDVADKWKPRAIAIEQVAFQAVVVQELLRQTTLPIKGVTPDKDKVTRAQPLALRYEQGLVFHEDLPSWFEDELLSFPQGAHDDGVDAAAYAYQSVMSMSARGGAESYVPPFEPLDAEMGF